MDNVEIWANAISDNMPEISHVELHSMCNQFAALMDNDGLHEEFCAKWNDIAAVIVEPPISDNQAEDEYHAWQEECVDQWITWINSNWGNGWSKVAQLVAEHGY